MRAVARSVLFAAVALLALAGAAGSQPAAAPATSCIACHGDADLFGEEGAAIVHRAAEDVHAKVGLSCDDCHGGNPDPELAEDMDLAMDEEHLAHPYRGAPARQEIPAFCGRCHSDPTYMRRFRPDVRVDQVEEYWTSQHGIALKAGDTAVATCVDCHGAHGILGAANPASAVYPTRVAETCRSCHGDAERMAGRLLPDGRPLPIDQYARWRGSVHARALLDREDLSAPTCNDCHGNHGASPPGLDSIVFVCGQCHGREAELFRASPKREGLELHNELLAEAGGEGCAACHAEPQHAAAVTALTSFSECSSCHGNHAVVRPTVALLAPLPDTPCSLCHEGPALGGDGGDVPEPEAQRRRYEETVASLLAAADQQGLNPADRFDWLVDQALELPTHLLPGGRGEAADGAPALRPEFERLFTKFRIGKIHFTYSDPLSGEEVRVSVLRCSTCHGEEGGAEEDSQGLATGAAFLRRTQELTALSARAERILLAARRGGVETRAALAELDQAVDAEVELQALVHTFSAAEDGPFVRKHAEGMQHAASALREAQRALAELGGRRRGLAISLVFIAVLLVALGLKIRQLSP